MTNTPPKRSPRAGRLFANQVEQGAKNMVNRRKITKIDVKQQINRTKQAIKNTRMNAKANVDRRRTQAFVNRRGRNNAGRGRIVQKREDTMRQLDEYIDYCNNLRASYDTKHGEVEEATERISSINDRLNGLTDKILKNIRKIQELNNVSNISNLSNNSSIDDFMGNNGRNNTDEMLAILQGIIDKLPAGFREDINRLRGLKTDQERMTAERGRNHTEINSRLDDITARLADIHRVKEGLMPKKQERGRNENPTPFIPPRRAAPIKSPTEGQIRNARLNRANPKTAKAKNAKNQLNKRFNRSTMKMVTGRGGPLTRNDFLKKFNPRK